MWLFDPCFFLLLYLILYYLFYFILFSRGSNFPFFFFPTLPLTCPPIPPLTQLCLPWPPQHQKAFSNLSHLWQSLSREMRQSPWHKGFWPGVKKLLLKQQQQKKPSEHSIAHTAFHSSCYAAPVYHISFQRLLSFLFTVDQPPIPKVLCYSAWHFCKEERQWFTYNNCNAWVSIANWP